MKRVRWSFLSLLLLALPLSTAFAQTRRISGTVRAESGEPLAAASVGVVGTTLGTYTDDQGRFSITVPSGPVTLRVRRIGFSQKTQDVGPAAADVTVSLTRDVLQLETQVVTGTATTVSSINAANAVTVISTERLNRVPAQTIDYALQGKVPGATITQNSGAPGGGVQIQIRGASTINAGFQPLYVIDGVIVDNSTINNGLNVISQSARGNFSSNQDQGTNRAADINPNDIENIQILKGPSASSIYGSRGSNGVIVITTKQGQSGKSTIDLIQRFGTARLGNEIKLHCFASAAEVASSDRGNFDSTGFGASTNKCHDYQAELYGEHPFDYQTVASARGATAGGTNFFLSGLVQHDGGLVRNDNYNKQSLRVNVGHKFSRLDLRGNSELVHSLTARGISGNDNTGINPLTAFGVMPSFIDYQRRADGTFAKGVSSASFSNPFQNAELIKTPENVYRLLGNANAKYSFIKQDRQTLDFELQGGVDSYSDHSDIVSPANGFVESVNALPGTVFKGDANVVNATLSGTLAHRLIRNPFTATTSFGFQQVRRNTDVVQVTGRGVFPGVTNVATATQTFPNEAQSIVKSLSMYGQEEFLTLDERLLLTAGVNGERNSNNGDPAKYYAYPKFSGSYRLPWLPPKTDEVKLRIAYGRAGNQPTSGKFTFLTNLVEEGVTGFRASTVKGFSAVKPETSSELEGGIDWTLFNGRARISATQFKRQVDNLILQSALAPSTGFSSQTINGGQVSHHGTELELAMTPIQTHGFEWVSNTTYASEKGKVTRLPVPGFITGNSFATRFGNAFIAQGQLITVVQAVNGCAVVTPLGSSCSSANRLLKFVGNANPDYQMGFSNDFTFGALRLSSLVDWRKGGLGVNLTNTVFDGGLIEDSAAGNRRIAEFNRGNAIGSYLEPTGFVKLRELTLGYELPASFSSQIFHGSTNRVRLELSGRNLKTWTKYTGLDPEVSNFGNAALGRFQDVTPYPPMKQYYFTINTSF